MALFAPSRIGHDLGIDSARDSTIDGGELRVVIGEADPTYSFALAQLLADAGFVFVGAAAAATELIELIDTTRPHAVALDVRLPGGPSTVVEEVVARGFACRLIAMAALITPATRAAAADAGLAPPISKLAGEQLIDALRTGS